MPAPSPAPPGRPQGVRTPTPPSLLGSRCPVCKERLLLGRQTVCSGRCRAKCWRARQVDQRRASASRDEEIRALLETALKKVGRAAMNRFAASLFLGTSIAVLIPALALVFFAEPVGDDFAHAAVVDVPHFVRSVYFQWSGRWAALGLEAFLLSSLPVLTSYSGILWGLQVVHFLALLAFWHMVVGSAVSLRGRLGLALGSYAFLLAGYPEPGETVYWVPGGIEYQLSMSLALLFLAIVCSSTQCPLRPSRALPRALALGLLGFIITGFHELVALMLLGALLTGTAFVLLERRPNLGMWLILLVFIALGIAVSILAPGNGERAATDFPHGRSISHGIAALVRLLMRVLRWIDVKLLLASVLFALTFGSQLRSSQDPSERAHLRTRVIPLAGVAILLGTCTTIAYVTGGVGPGRSQNLLYMTFCIAWFTSLLTLLKAAPGLSYRPDHSFVRIGQHVTAVLLSMSLLVSSNNGIAMRDLLFDAVAWRRAMTDRYELVRQAARLDGPAADVVVPPVVHPPTFYRDLDIGPSAEFFHNRLFAEHFGVRSVRVGLRESGHQSSSVP
jgi:hypothetical protein